MKRIGTLSIAILCFVSIMASSIAQKEKHDKSVLPDTLIQFIENSDSVRWILLDPMVTDSTCNSYAIIGEPLMQVNDTCEERTNALISTLTYSKSFEDKIESKESTFLPDIACKFYHNGECVCFSYSFYCDLCRFEYNSTFKEYDGELIRESILQFAMEVFPKDRYIRKIAGRSR